MPLLRREPDVFPEDLFSLPIDQFPWLVAHVRSRQEKVLGRYLHERSVPFYLPQIEQAKKRGGRNFRSYLPLFPGYVFVRGDDDVRNAVWRSDVIVNLIAVMDQQELGSQLEELRALQLRGASLRPYHHFVAGDAVLIRDGVFSGYRGIVVREKGRDRLLISISLLRQTASVELDREVIGTPPTREVTSRSRPTTRMETRSRRSSN
ncbi:MAG TPA: transcription termination/antitermination NusG family protein [Thermoanaerobaculia bacterium]|nr:transcription termination/antitermination NusG family protein [Thermoanaerobaculia bacterium]